MTDKSEIIVVHERQPNSNMGRRLVKHLTEKPHENSIQEISRAIEAPEDQVAEILHSYTPDGRGGVKYAGEGQGGSWLPEEVAEQYRNVAPQNAKKEQRSERGIKNL